MATTSLTLDTITANSGAQHSGLLARALALLVEWRERARQRRELSECAAVAGHRFASDTLIALDEVAAQTRKPLWDGAMLRRDRERPERDHAIERPLDSR